MIDYDGIEATLNRLKAEYDLQNVDDQMPILFSKLAIIEFCGWIEESIDDVLYEYINMKILDPNCIRLIKVNIKKNNGFNYENNIFKLFSMVVGMNNWENIIDALPPIDMQNFETILSQYSTYRNKAAHTHTPIGTTRTYDSPSMVLNNYRKIKNALQFIENQMRVL